MDFFDIYVILLVISGILTLGLGISAFGGASVGVRAVNIVVGAAFLGYGVYLGLFFDGDSYFVLLRAFILPVVLVANAIRTAVDKRQKNVQVQPPFQQGYVTPPPGYPMPQPGYPAAPAPGFAPTQPGYPTPAGDNTTES